MSLVDPVTPRERVLAYCSQVSQRHGVKLGDLFTKSVDRKLCKARFEIWLELHEEWGWSTNQIGRLFGRDHSTIVMGLKRQRERDLVKKVA